MLRQYLVAVFPQAAREGMRTEYQYPLNQNDHGDQRTEK